MVDSSDSSDDELGELQLFINCIEVLDQPRKIRDRSNPFEEYNNEEFRCRYRLTKDAVFDLLEEIGDQLQHDSLRNSPLSPLNMILITLRFYASSSFQLVIGDLSGVSQPTVSRIIKKVSILIAALVHKLVQFPMTREERASTMTNFHRIAQFPGVLGAIDCTHVSIKSPGGDQAELFRNRKGYFSINVQAICDSSLRYTNVVARWHGSAHDANIFANSKICAQFETGQIPSGYLLGDGGYGCSRYMLTPLANTATPAEQNYNYAQIRSRNVVERSFGVLKKRWPCLQLQLRLKLQTSLTVIVSCFVLHNIALHHGDNEAPDDTAYIAGRRVYEELPAPVNARGQNGAATAVRTALIRDHF